MDKAIRAGQKAGIKWGKMDTDPKEFEKGMKVEKEHGSKMGKDTNITKNNPVATARIAHAHLKEDPKYYSHLDKMEESAKTEKGKGQKAKKRQILRNLIKEL